MKKNTVLFVIILVVAYGIFFFQQSKKEKAYQEALNKYKADRAAWDALVETRNTQRDAARKALEDAQAKIAAMAVTDDATSPTLSNAQGGGATLSTQRDLLTKVSTVSTAPQHTVEMKLYSIKFSEFGARVIDWEINSSEYVRNLKPGGTRNDLTTVPLIPQVGDFDIRSWPFELNGTTARDFNDVLFSMTQEKVSGGTRVTLTSDPKDDMVVVKEFLLRDDSYVVDLKVTFKNGGTTRKRLGREKGVGIGWNGGFGEPEAMDRIHGTTRTVIAADDSIRSKSIGRTDAAYILESASARIDWVGEERKFFTFLIMPDAVNPAQSIEASFEKKNDDAAYQAKGVNMPISVQVNHASHDLDLNESYSLLYQVYAGPKNREAMKDDKFKIPPGAVEPSRLIFHEIPMKMNFMRAPCHWLLSLMIWLHGLLGTWGIAIICTTIIVRLAIYPITHWTIKNQAKTMAQQAKIRPELDVINQKYKNDPMKKSQAMMQLYRDHNVSMVGGMRGCFPALLQMPIFMSLIVIFDQSVELRGQSFLWIQDLSQPDRLIDWGVSVPLIGTSLNILPIIMAVTSAIQMRIMRVPMSDPTQESVQKQMTLMMPIMFLFFLYSLPSGLSLYWVISNIISIGQSYLTKKIIADHMAQHEAEKNRKFTIEKSTA
ncbi:YidC/Oxa1 family insertase periplasmic-domain containing protein [Candidatus Sumerlaeota bacterium]|nr:YidC/Oxa1 family insertase periplasmic-domain containing protein [Candidatus Sumerlaeota bacterium]